MLNIWIVSPISNSKIFNNGSRDLRQNDASCFKYMGYCDSIEYNRNVLKVTEIQKTYDLLVSSDN